MEKDHIFVWIPSIPPGVRLVLAVGDAADPAFAFSLPFVVAEFRALTLELLVKLLRRIWSKAIVAVRAPPS